MARFRFRARLRPTRRSRRSQLRCLLCLSGQRYPLGRGVLRRSGASRGPLLPVLGSRLCSRGRLPGRNRVRRRRASCGRERVVVIVALAGADVVVRVWRMRPRKKRLSGLLYKILNDRSILAAIRHLRFIVKLPFVLIATTPRFPS